MATMIRTLAALVTVLGLLAVGVPATAQPLYSITNLGRLPDARACAASAINDLGAVAGTCTGAGALNETAFVWRKGVMKSLGKLPRGNYSAAHAINAQGVAVGEGDTGDFRPDPTLYRKGKVLNVDSGGANARAIYVNDDGVVVGNYLKGFSGVSGWKPVIWTERRDKPGRFDRISLAPYPGGDANARYGYAMGANQGLQVVGYVQNSLFGGRGAFWDNDATHTLTLLQPPAGHWTSLALAVNDLGQAVGQSHPPFRTRAVLWLNDAGHTPVELGTLPGDVDSTATAINNAAQIVGLSISASGVSRPFLWQNGQMLDVSALLDAGGAEWVLQSITAINNAGRMVGLGLYRGHLRTFLLTPAGQ